MMLQHGAQMRTIGAAPIRALHCLAMAVYGSPWQPQASQGPRNSQTAMQGNERAMHGTGLEHGLTGLGATAIHGMPWHV